MTWGKFLPTVIILGLILLSGQPTSSIVGQLNGGEYLSPDLDYGTEYSWVVTERENIETEFREIEDNYVFGSKFFYFSNPEEKVDVPMDNEGSTYAIILGEEFASQQLAYTPQTDEEIKWFTDNFLVTLDGATINLVSAFDLKPGLLGIANEMVRTFFTPFLVNETGTYSLFDEFTDDPELCFEDPNLENCETLLARFQFGKEQIIDALLQLAAEGNYSTYFQVYLDNQHRTVRRYFEEDYFIGEATIRFCDQETCNSRDDLSIFSSYIEIWDINTGVLMKSSSQRIWIDNPDRFVKGDETRYTEKFEITNKVYLDNNRKDNGVPIGNNSVYSLFFGFGILVIFRKKHK